MQAPPFPSPSLVFTRDIPCIHCGYNLRTISTTALCPECGKPAIDALDSLNAAEPHVIARLRIGLLLLMVAGSVIPVIAVGVPMLSALLGSYYNISRFDSVMEYLLFASGFAIAILGPTAACVGTFFLSTPPRRSIDHTVRIPAASPPARWTMLAASLLYPIFGSTVWLIALAMSSPAFRPSGSNEEPILVFIITSALLGLSAWSLRNTLASPLLANLCRRSGARRFARIFSIMTWLSAAMLITIILAGIIALIAYLFHAQIEAFFDRTFPAGVGGNGAMDTITIALGVLNILINFAFVGWMFLWPISLIVMLRHLSKVGTQAALNTTGLLGAPPADEGLPPLAPPTAPPTTPVLA
jgi:hypothetical protein